MAGKQLGKLRQWAGEVISTREKAQPSSEFVALEQEMEARKKGLENLQTASREFLEYISQKKQTEAAPGETITHSEALGVAMLSHGEELGDTSALGRSLASYGRARCRIATLQNVLAVTANDTFLSFLERAKAKLDEYTNQRRKLDSRRLAYDSAITKAEKTYKKEKDRKEAEEELARAKARYEEMAEDVTTRIDAIREGEVEYQRELKNFLESEIKFVQQYLDVLLEVEAEWPKANTYADLRLPTTSIAAPHDFSRFSTRSTESSDAKQSSNSSKYGSTSSARSTRSGRSRKSSISYSAEKGVYASDADDDAPRSRAPSRMSRKSSKGSRTPSRMSKKRQRSGSTATVGASGAEDTADDADSVKTNSNKHKKASGSVTGWMGDAVSNVMSRNKATKNPDVDNFATLDDDEKKQAARNGRNHARRLSDRSTKSTRSATGRSRSRTRENGKIQRKVMKAIYDFSGSGDELSFTAGEEIIVINEVLDDWWMGELNGRKGLFPIKSTVFIGLTEYTPTVSMKFKNASTTSILGLNRGKVNPDDVESRRTLVEPSDSELSMSEDERDAESVDEWHPFGDGQEDLNPRAQVVLPASEERDITDRPRKSDDSFMAEDEFNRQLSSSLVKLNIQQQTPSATPSRSITPSGDSQISIPAPSPRQRMPPPPPPRRQTTSAAANGPPPLPVRNALPSRVHSSSAALHSLGPPVMDRRPFNSGASSPFDSHSDSSFDVVATTKMANNGRVGCFSCGCNDFVEDAFRGHGLCANCTHEHM